MAKKKKNTWPKSCNKLKHRHPQNIKRTIAMHPQGLDTMVPTEEEAQEEQK